jgi:murein DD-endopeptidase MepM/ murein hydrolase activator NlpD
MGFIETVLSDAEKNKAFFTEIKKVLRQQNYDTAIQDKEIDLIRQMYSPSGLIIQERVSQATSRFDPAAKLPAEALKGWRKPLADPIIVTSEQGPRNGTHHDGIDLDAHVGTPVFAAKAGRVVTASWEGGYGYSVVINHGDGIFTRYAHNSALRVRVGEQVAQGQQISFAGKSGHSFGAHLHFEVRIGSAYGQVRNPRDFITF